MRRIAITASVLTLALTSPLTAQAPAPAGPPHAWLFGAWIGGMFPAPVTLTAQECLAQPMVIFTRDVVMRAVMTTPAYAQRLIDSARATADGFEVRLVSSPSRLHRFSLPADPLRHALSRPRCQYNPRCQYKEEMSRQ
jgi:hypothetical protein